MKRLRQIEWLENWTCCFQHNTPRSGTASWIFRNVVDKAVHRLDSDVIPTIIT